MKAARTPRPARVNDPVQPGTNGNHPSLSPPNSATTGGLWNMIKGGNSPKTSNSPASRRASR